MTMRFGKSFIVAERWCVYGRLPSGLGLCVELTRRAPLFSERNGYRKVHRFGPLRLEVLR